MNTIHSVLLSLLVVLIGSGPLWSAAAGPKRGGTLSMAILKDLSTMNPVVQTISTDRSIRALMYEPLLGIDLKGNIHPNLAESWRISQDGKVFTVNLRKGVKFHNGAEMQAEDIKFVVDYTLDSKNGAYGYSRLALFDRVEVVDRHTVNFHLKRPSAAMVPLLTDISTFPVIPKGSLREENIKPDSFPPGTGPFKFAEWKPKQRIVFDRFDDYWGQKTLLDRVILRPVTEETVRIAALRAGDVDIVERAPYEWAKEIKDGKVKGLGLAEAEGADYHQVVFNISKPPIDNVKLRQAIAHAINRKEILAGAFFGFGHPAEQKYPRGHSWYVDGAVFPNYDPEKARRLLKEAGYSGQPIEVTPERGRAAEISTTILQAQLKKIGMNIVIKVLEYNAHRDVIRRGEMNFDFMGSAFYPDPATTYAFLRCEPNPNNRTANYSGYCDKEMDALLAALETENDMEKRKAMLRKVVGKINDDLPVLPAVFVPRFFAFRDHVKGFTTDDRATFRWWAGGLSHAWLEK